MCLVRPERGQMHHFTGTAEQRGKSNERGMCQKGARRKEGRAIYYYTDDKTNPNAETKSMQ